MLQLRVNHQFGHIDLGVCEESKMTVIEMGFEEECLGCVTLSYVGGIGPLKAHLYRE